MVNLPSFRFPKWVFVWIGVILAAGAIFIYVLAPWLIRRILVREVSAALQRPVEIESVSINPFRLSVGLSGVSVPDADHSELLGWDRLVVNLSAASLWNGSWTFDEIRLTKGRIHVGVSSDGRLNLESLLKGKTKGVASVKAGEEPSAPRPIVISKLVLEDCEASYTDASKGAHFASRLGPIQAVFKNLTTKNEESGESSFSASTELGERLSWHGRLHLQPMSTKGRLELDGIRLAKYARYIEAVAPVRVPSGLLTLTVDYAASFGVRGVEASVSGGRLEVRDLSVANAGSANDLLDASALLVEGIHADTSTHTAGATDVRLTSPSITLKRFADGRLDLPVTPVVTVPGAPAAVSPASAPWTIRVGSVKVDGGTVAFTDASTRRPVSLNLGGLALAVTDFSTKPGSRSTVDLSFKYQEKGDVRIHGSVGIDPLAADLDVHASGIELPSAGPYLAPFANVELTEGAARAAGHLTAAVGPDGRLNATWKGDAGLSGLDVVDPVGSERLVSLGDLAVNGMNLNLAPLAVDIRSVVLKDPSVRAVMLADKRLNFATVRPARSAAAASPAAPTEGTPAPVVAIGSFEVSNARVSYEDRSFTPGFSLVLDHLDGRVDGLSSKDLARASVDIGGDLGSARLQVKGQINPLAKDVYSDVSVRCNGIELPPFTPYSGRFVGYTVAKGKLSLNLRYRISSNELIAENHVVLDQFYLGQPVPSPEAVKLPVKLGLALLRDRNGRISVDLPIRGNLGDPDFRYGKLVWQAVGNVLVKAAASPFSLLAGIVGKKEDLSRIDFEPGRSVLGAEALQRLNDLANALRERPDLTLEIAPATWTAADDRGLREVALERELRAMKWRDLSKEGQAHGDISSVTLTPAEFERYLTIAYTAEHPAGVAAAAAKHPAEAPAAAAAPRTRKDSERTLAIWRTLARLLHFPTRHAPAPTAPVAAPATAVAATLSGPSLVEMRAALLAEQKVPQIDREKLLADREARIQSVLTTQGKIAPGRLFLVNAAAAGTARASDGIPSVRFTLR